MYANGWFTACDGFYGASACCLSHMKQSTNNKSTAGCSFFSKITRNTKMAWFWDQLV